MRLLLLERLLLCRRMRGAQCHPRKQHWPYSKAHSFGLLSW
jgi:hypothetical protein